MTACLREIEVRFSCCNAAAAAAAVDFAKIVHVAGVYLCMLRGRGLMAVLCSCFRF